MVGLAGLGIGVTFSPAGLAFPRRLGAALPEGLPGGFFFAGILPGWFRLWRGWLGALVGVMRPDNPLALCH